MADFVVTRLDDVTADDGQLTLREAIDLANAISDADTITFDAGLTGSIVLTQGELLINNELSIDGDVLGDDNIADITIDANGASRVFNLFGGPVTLDALTMTGGNAVSGGAVRVNNAAKLELINATLLENTAVTGGGIHNSGTATLNNVIISVNHATLGGGIENIGKVTLTNTTLSGNIASDHGGGISNRGEATLIATTLSENTSEGRGGGIDNISGATLTLTSTTLSGNTAYRAGGIYNKGLATLTMTNSTLSGNAAQYDGGGIVNGGTAILTNSIVLGNRAASALATMEITGTVYASFSIIGDGDETAADVFTETDGNGGGLLADNGGPVQTIALKADASNPALDAADNLPAPELDAAGNARVDLSGLGATNSITDMGALELVSGFDAGLIVTTLKDDGTPFDGLVSLREAIAFANSDGVQSNITFAAGLTGTIILTHGELVISSDLSIDGDVVGDDDIADITIDGNNASRVFRLTGGTATLDALTITGGNADRGGGVQVNSAAILNLLNTTMSENIAGFGGGIYNYGTVTLTNTTLSENTGNSGGGIFNHSVATATLNNTTLSGNIAVNYGGGIFNNGIAALTNSTLSGNTARISGGGFDNRNTATATVTNSIVLGNSALNFADVDGTVNAFSSIIGDGAETAADVFAEPDGIGGGLLADNGGPVQTIALRNDTSNPALDAGDDSLAPLTDAAGNSRTIDFLAIANNGTNKSDLGALELSGGAPVFTSVKAVSVAENQTAAIRAQATGDLAPVTYTLETGFDSKSFNIDAASGVLSFKAAPNFEAPVDVGKDNSYVAQITARDAVAGLSTTSNVTVNVTNVNEAPVLAAALADRTSPEDARFSFALPSGAFTDVDSALTYSARQASGADLPSWISFNAATRTFAGTPPREYAGTLVMRVTASDGALSVSDVFNLAITPVNDAPVLAKALPDQSSAEDTAVNFALPASAFTDVDSALTYSAKQASGADLPSWISFNAATPTFAGTPPRDFTGTLALRVTASDGALSVSDVFSLAITPVNDAPVLAKALLDQSSAEDTAVNFALPASAFTDVDSALTLSASLSSGAALPGWLRFDAAKAAFSGTPPQDFNGTVAVKVTASDGALKVSDSFNLVITPVDDPMTLTGTRAGGTQIGGAAADLITGSFGNDTINGNGGDDVILDAGGDNVIFGGAGNDRIGLMSGNNTVSGGADDDLIVGGYDNDSLSGDAGNDVIVGDISTYLNGADRIAGGTGDDLLEGRGGADTFVFDTNDGADIIGALTLDLVNPVNSTVSGADFQSGIDIVLLQGFGMTTGAEALAKVADVSGVATFADQGTSITFAGLTAADLSVNDFQFL